MGDRGFVVLRRLGADFQFLGEQDWVSRLDQAQTWSTYRAARQWRDEAQHGQVMTHEEAELIDQAIGQGDKFGASLAAARVAGAEIRHVTLTSARADSAAPATQPQASERAEATEAGPLAAEREGGRPGRRQSERHAPPAGAAELALPPAPCDPGGSPAGRSGTQLPPMSTGGSTPIPCEVCGQPIPARSIRYCDDACRLEAIRRARFVKRKRARWAMDGQQ